MIVALLCLLAAWPPGVCLCAHDHAPAVGHDDHAAAPPQVAAACHCHDGEPDHAPPPRPADAGEHPAPLTPAADWRAVDRPPASPTSRTDSVRPPPLPLYLSTSRLRN